MLFDLETQTQFNWESQLVMLCSDPFAFALVFLLQ